MNPEVLASEERGSGPALLFVHGFPLHAGMWRAQVAGLPKQATCYAVDLRGVGMSAGINVDGASINLMADDIATTLEDLGVDAVDLAALSMGGYVAFAFLKRHPQKVRSLILIDTKAEGDSEEAKAGRDGAAALVREQGMGPLWDKLKTVLFGDNPDEEVVADAEKIILGTPPESAAAHALAMRDRDDYTVDLASISVPVTWIHGTQDKLMPLAGAQTAAAQIPNAEFVAIENAGHLSPMEQPEAVNAAIKAHLERVR